jgi:hypothetical protein
VRRPLADVKAPLIADAMFAEASSAGVPKLVTADQAMCVGLARAFAVLPRNFSPTGAGGIPHWEQLLARFPEGHFTIEVHGHKLEIFFGQAHDQPPSPP